MLDTATKRRIDTARDILVGKVPDPKSQVEQITIALIYKFMDDMDAESEELGGKRAFFAGEYGRYGWAKLMRSGLGGHETLNLYSEAIATMPENPGIPPLFRTIFKNAYLPYRDPETLKSFLKIIDEFEYDHSERLGDAFEYLLSVLGSQGDAGQFRTPRHIIDFMVQILDPKKEEVILDPACGTAGFLISSYKHILRANTDAHGNSTLTPDEKGRLARNFKGYDISPDMVRLSLVNLYLHGFVDPHIEEYDTLTSEDKWNEFADVILANPPFMSPKGGIKPHRRFSVQSKRSEVLFVDYMAEHLTPNGRAGIIVPEGIIFQSGTSYKQLRKMLVDKSLVAVISLPAGVFQPYSGVKTSILILDKSLARRSNSVAFFKVENDGFGLGAQRRAIEKNDLSAAFEFLKAWFASIGSGREVLSSPNALIVPKEKIAENGDYNLSGERYRENAIRLSNYPLVPIGEVCELINGRAFKPEDWKSIDSGGLPIVRIQNLNTPDSQFNYYTGDVSAQHIIDSGELLFSWSGSRGTSFGAHIWYGGRAVLNQHIFKVGFSEDQATKMYLFHALNNAVAEIEENLHGGVGLVHITKGNMERIQIPLPPLEVQKEIVAEIDGYQKVIDGARAVLDNYRPHIQIDPEWPIVTLNDVCDVRDGTHDSPNYVNEGYPLITSKNLKDGYIDFSVVNFISKEDFDNINKRSKVDAGDILMPMIGTIGNPIIVDTSREYAIKNVALIKFYKDTAVNNQYVKTILASKSMQKIFDSQSSGSTQRFISLGFIRKLEIPLPPLATQQTIVAEIEAEQALVAANRELIQRFEKKIQATIARVWGADEPIPTGEA